MPVKINNLKTFNSNKYIVKNLVVNCKDPVTTIDNEVLSVWGLLKVYQ